MLKVLLQGPPKIGKTTIVERLVKLLSDTTTKASGFVTTELREHGRRVGFVVRDLAGPHAVIAHQDFATEVRVGRFGVDLMAFEHVALPALVRAMDGDAVVVIDEVARMELASTGFIDLLDTIMNSSLLVVGTVHVHSHPVTDVLLRRADVEVIQVDKENRDELPSVLLNRITQCAESGLGSMPRSVS
jgi:nucleoside-triphosphatase